MFATTPWSEDLFGHIIAYNVCASFDYGQSLQNFEKLRCFFPKICMWSLVFHYGLVELVIYDCRIYYQKQIHLTLKQSSLLILSTVHLPWSRQITVMKVLGVGLFIYYAYNVIYSSVRLKPEHALVHWPHEAEILRLLLWPPYWLSFQYVLQPMSLL